ncbi:hypothetical protein JXA32_14835 [Candidatus Sumerlaeota bacterium]|nr:hypothetical protein [Candidatus Sumerlaeota bacterium]
MEDYIRIYCIADHPPTLKEIIGWLQDEEMPASINKDTLDGERTGEWNAADLTLKKVPGAIQLDCLTPGGDNALDYQTALDELDNWMEDLEEIGEANPVREHLDNTQFIIQLQLSDEADEVLNDAMEIVLQETAVNFEGIVQRGGDGFFDSEGEPLMEAE